MEATSRVAAAARHAQWLFVASAVLAFALAAVPGEADAARLLGVGLATLAVAGVARVVPWQRFRPAGTLALVPLAFALIGASSVTEVMPVRTYGVYFVLVFAWVGVHHPPLTAVKLVPVAIPFYVVPLTAVDAEPPFDPRAVVVAMAVAVLVGETIARGNRATEEARCRAERAAEAFRVVGQTSVAARRLDPDEVLAAVVDGATALGYDSANLAVLEPGGDRFRAIHPRGLATTYADGDFPVSAGLTGQVIESGGPVVVADYQTADRSIGPIRACGVRTCIGVPVYAGEQLAAVLLVGDRDRHPVFDEDVEALKLLAGAAGAALLNIAEFEAERDAAASNAVAASTDELTGLPNRRAANQLLSHLRAGDAVVMVDLDWFKAVNDDHGHAAGDQLLQRFAQHLADHLRAADRVARYGGEEFLLILPATSLTEAEAIVERLLDTWRAIGARTTFSAGIATCLGGEDAEDTVGRADAAMFAAKAAGRDRCRLAAGERLVLAQ